MICPGCSTIFGFAVPPSDKEPVQTIHCPRCGKAEGVQAFKPKVVDGKQSEVERLLGMGVRQEVNASAGISLRHIL